MIYFAQPLSGGPVKIGTSENVDARIRQLEAHYGQPLALLGTIPGGWDEEREIHARFAHLRLERTGRRGVQPEQFQPVAELMAFIGRPLLIDAYPDVVEAMKPRNPPDGMPVKLDSGVVGKAKMVATAREISLAEYLTELLRGPVDRDFAREMKRLVGEGQ